MSSSKSEIRPKTAQQGEIDDLSALSINKTVQCVQRHLSLTLLQLLWVHVENHICDVCELKASVYLQHFIAWKGELLFDLVTASVDVILDVFDNVCAR